MSQVNKNISPKKPAKKKLSAIFIASGILVVLIVAFAIIKGGAGTDTKAGTEATNGAGITITKSDITEKATFIPYQDQDQNNHI